MKHWKLMGLILATSVMAKAQTVVPNGTIYPSGETDVSGPATIETHGNVVVPAGADVIYGADTWIRLTPGFQVQAGGFFQAFITQWGYIDIPANINSIEELLPDGKHVKTTIYFSVSDGGRIVESSISFTDAQAHPWLQFQPPYDDPPYSVSSRIGGPRLGGPGYVFWILRDTRNNAANGRYTEYHDHVFAAFYKRKPFPGRWEIVELKLYKGGGADAPEPYTITFDPTKIILALDSIQWEVRKVKLAYPYSVEVFTETYAIPKQEL